MSREYQTVKMEKIRNRTILIHTTFQKIQLVKELLEVEVPAQPSSISKKPLQKNHYKFNLSFLNRLRVHTHIIKKEENKIV